MNNGQGHATESNTGSLDRNRGGLPTSGSRNMNGSVPTFEKHPWKRCNVDIEDEELIREVTGIVTVTIVIFIIFLFM